MTFLAVRLIIHQSEKSKQYLSKEVLMKKQSKITGPLILVTAAMIWGLSFVAQRDGMQYVDGFTFTAVRLIIATIVLFPIALFRSKKQMAGLTADEKKAKRKMNIKAIIPVGLCLCIGLNLQQFAFKYTEVGKVGFLTALYMLLVPVFGLFFKKKPPLTAWLGVGLGLCGLYLICMGAGSGMSLGIGEVLTLACAVAFAWHIIVIDVLASEVDSFVLSCGQFFIAGVISTVLMFVYEKPDFNSIIHAGIPILYAGVFSSGIAFTLQIIGQKNTEPTIASMLLCLESVFAVLFALILPPHEMMQTAEYIGCGIMFIAILIAQIPSKKKL